MSLNNVNVIKGSGGLGRALPSKSHYSGYLHYADGLSLPSGWDSTGFETVFSIDEVENLGLTAGTIQIAWYHINEFFRIQPKGVFYIALKEGSGTFSQTYDEVIDLNDYSEGQIRQCLVYNPTQSTVLEVEALQAQADVLEQTYRPCQFILDGTNDEVVGLANYPDLTGSADQRKNISVTIGCDSGAVAGLTVSAAGTLLGAVALSDLHQDIAWVQNFNIASSTYFDNPFLMSGEDLKNVTDTQLEALKNKSYIGIRKFVDYTGIYFTDSDTCAPLNSDYSKIESNRTIDSAVRDVRLVLLPRLNSPLYVEKDGSLSTVTIKGFEASCEGVLQLMQNLGQISNFSVTIDPDQDVLSDSTLDIYIAIQPVGVARFINVNISFAIQVAT